MFHFKLTRLMFYQINIEVLFRSIFTANCTSYFYNNVTAWTNQESFGACVLRSVFWQRPVPNLFFFLQHGSCIALDTGSRAV